MEEPQFGRRTGESQAFYFSKDALVWKSWFLHKGQAPFRNFHSPWRFFPRASERRVLPIVGVCISSSHLHIFTSAHLHIFSLHIFSSSHLHIFSLHIFWSSHLLIFTSSHLHIFTSSHLHIFSSSHLLIFTSAHLHICSSLHLHICSSSHLLIFTPSHLHIFSSSHLLIFTSAHLHICSSSHLLIFTSSHLHIFTSSHLHILTSSHLLLLPSCPLALLPLLPSPSFLFLLWRRGRGQCQRDGTKRNPFARNEVRSSKTAVKLWFARSSRATLTHETRFDRQKLRWNCDLQGPTAHPFRTKRSITENLGKIAISTCPAQPFRTKRGSIFKN